MAPSQSYRGIYQDYFFAEKWIPGVRNYLSDIEEIDIIGGRNPSFSSENDVSNITEMPFWTFGKLLWRISLEMRLLHKFKQKQSITH